MFFIYNVLSFGGWISPDVPILALLDGI